MESMAGQGNNRLLAEGHRSKRIKTESHLENSTSFPTPLAEDIHSSNGLPLVGSAHMPSLPNGDEANGHTHSLSDIEALANNAAASAMEGFGQQGGPDPGEFMEDSTAAGRYAPNDHQFLINN